jgi:hypothetical protein
VTDTRTPRGIIHYGGRCVDDYDNLSIYDQPPAGGAPIRLQAPALRAFKAAERTYGKHRPAGRRSIILTGSWRSCELQRALHDSDPARFAHEDTSLHPRGLAIDVAMPLPFGVRHALIEQGWKQARPDDEPWHFSWWTVG